MALRSPLYRSFFAFRAIFVHEKIRVFAVGYELLSMLKWAVRPVATSRLHNYPKSALRKIIPVVSFAPLLTRHENVLAWTWQPSVKIFVGREINGYLPA